jgi:tRNA threonylcarbamoyladenosine biosynthesis protein TsaE
MSRGHAPQALGGEPQRFLLATRRATIHFAHALAPRLGRGDLCVLSGPLGSGKTFLARAICRALGVPADERVTSPTFTLVNELTGAGGLPILHADLYRIESRRDVEDLGLRDRRADALILCEWGERWEAELGGGALRIALAVDARGRVATLDGAPAPLARALASLTR